MREVGSTDVVLRYLPLKAISKKLRVEEALFDFFDKFEIQDFGDVALVLY